MTRDDDLLDQFGEMPDEYLECRGTQHRMNITDPFRIVDTDHEAGQRPHLGHKVYAKRDLECDRCGMVRHDFYAITSRGGHTVLQKINATYEAPEGYATVGLGRTVGSRGLLLGMSLDRAMSTTPVRGRGRPRRER